MASLLFSILIGLSSNSYNIELGPAYQGRKARTRWLLGSLFAGISFLACLMGGATALRIGRSLPVSTWNLLGTLIIVCIGSWTVMQTFAFAADAPLTETAMGFSEMMFVALALGLTDLSIGFATGFIKLNVLHTALAVGIFSFLSFVIPVRLRIRLVPRRFGQGVTFVSGALLIVLGLLF